MNAADADRPWFAPMPSSTPPLHHRHGLALALGGLCVICFLVYARYNQRYVGAVDWYGYYQEGLLFKSGRLTLPVELPADKFPAGVPLGFTALPDGRVAPQYPPGYPLLLAAAATWGLEFQLMPLIGVASCLLMFVLVRDLTGDRWVALLWTALWAFCPIVVYGSTTLMSDLVAAAFLAFSYWRYRRGDVAGSACALVFAICVRPVNGLYLLPFAVVLLRDGRAIRYGLFMLLPATLYGLYNQILFGAPWRTGYSGFDYDLITGVFTEHLGFYSWQTTLQLSPLLLLFIPWGFRRPRGEAVFLAAWFAIYLLFYCFWRSGSGSWWWTRFLLPGYPPLFLLAARGFGEIRELLGRKFSGSRRAIVLGALFGLTALVPAYFIQFGAYQRDLWSTHKGYIYYQAVQETAGVVPAGSYVGSVELAGAFRLYSPLRSFVSVHGNAPALVDHVLADGHAAYVLVEPWNRNHPAIVSLLARYSAEKVQVFNIWGGLALYRLHAPVSP